MRTLWDAIAGRDSEADQRSQHLGHREGGTGPRPEDAAATGGGDSPERTEKESSDPREQAGATALVPYTGPQLGSASYEGHPVRLPLRTGSASAGVVADRGNWGPFTVYAASQAGADHEVRGRYREDAYAFSGCTDEPSVIVVAVADGVSSSWAAHAAAGVGASQIVRTLSEQVGRHGPPTPEKWDKRARQAVRSVARLLETARLKRQAAAAAYELPVDTSPQEPRPPATTLVFAVCYRSERGFEVYYGGVGDARVDVLNLTRQSWSHLYPREGSSPAHDNRTNAMPRDADTVRMGCATLADDDVIALASDGFGKGLDVQPQVLATEIASVIGQSPKASDFLRMVDWKMRGNNDDRTVAVVWSHPPRGA
ncbi:protein phosphatase 2C domain-containing protein [Streptomyces sp. NPDC087305]|uniref:protein phosphatase 2C domain-containing protein n=1 Tax=Streptomyces sp. NPDC087305 TaxID=3365781 RepID=UPI003820252B